MADNFKDVQDPKLVELIATGAVGVLPTDTLYGIVCSVKFPDSVKRLVGFKGRQNNPGTLVAASAGQLIELGLKARYLLDLRRTSTLLGKLSRDAEVFFSEGNVAKATLPEEKAVMRPGSLSGVAGILRKSSLSAVSQFWPGATSVVIPAPEGLASLHLGRRSLAVRIPDDHQLIGLLEKTGPLMTTSANRPGETPAATVEVAQSIFGHEVDFYVDGGDLSDHQPSTIIRVVDDAIEILRSGAVKIDETGRIIE